MKWMSTLIFIGLLYITSALRHPRGLTAGLDHPISQIFSPIDVPCNISMCTGPLAGIYCHGPILTNAWQFGLEKTCPGDKLRVPADQVLANFGKLQYPLKIDDFKKFCEENFEQVAYLQIVDLKDWRPNEKFLEKIKDQKLKKFAAELHDRWNRLAREFTSDVVKNPDLYPLEPVINPFIVPGGRFDVYFYWDTYWIIKGLLVSGMFETVRGIIENFASLVEKLGYIPNSGNLQLTRRSQPPLFPHMVWEYTKATGKYKQDWLPLMVKEMKFWEANRTVNWDGNELFVYRTLTNCPRPENFLADYKLGLQSENPSQVWKSISSACESGWDFSSRWMHSNSTDLSGLHTDQIIPVDLNVIMANNYHILTNYSKELGYLRESSGFRDKFETLTEGIQKTLWDQESGAWFDFDMLTNTKNSNFYPSNVYPLMLPGFQKYADKVENYIKKSGVLQFVGGIPSALPAKSTQQWDFPNVWAPNQHFIIQSFLLSGNTFLAEEAKKQALKFIESVYNGLYNPEPGLEAGIWEKYDARSTVGRPGAGGEYVVQEGFGWTNGAVLDLIWTFNPVIAKPRELELTSAQNASIIYVAAGFCGLVALMTLVKGIMKYRMASTDDVEAAETLLGGHDDEEDDL